MSVLPRMKLKNEIADMMWIDWPSIGIACRRLESDLGGSGRKRKTYNATILNYRAPIRLSITLSPPLEESSRIRK